MDTPRLHPAGGSFCLLAAVAAIVVAGCAKGPVQADPAVTEKLRDTLLLTAEPDGAQTPLDWREAAEPEDESSEPAIDTSELTPVVLMGRVGGMPNPWPDDEKSFPWREGEATFFLVDPATADEFADHADEEGDDHAADCPYCAREAAAKSNAIAAVSFQGDNGKPLKVDVRQLFGLEKGDTVVVRGSAKLLGGELLLVEADGLFRR